MECWSAGADSLVKEYLYQQQLAYLVPPLLAGLVYIRVRKLRETAPQKKLMKLVFPFCSFFTPLLKPDEVDNKNVPHIV